MASDSVRHQGRVFGNSIDSGKAQLWKRIAWAGVQTGNIEVSTETKNTEVDEGEAQESSLVGSLGKGLNYDFCPQYNKYVYWLKKPFGWVICGAAFSALVGLLIGPQGYVLMWSFIALLLIGSVWPWLGMKGLDCSLHFRDARIHEGEPASVTLEVRNRWPLPMFGLMVEGEFLQDIEEEDDKIAVGLQRIPGWSVCRFEWNFEPRRRGKLPLLAPVLANGFPFGIYRSEKDVEVIDQTIVWPMRQELKGQPHLDGDQFNIEGLMSDRFGEDGEIIGVRNYRQGDSLRNVHWQKTASGRELVVKERQKCAQKPIQVLVDLLPSTHCGLGSQSSYEWAIRVAANICQQLHRGHSHIEVVCTGLPREELRQGSNRRGMTSLLDFFAMLPQQAELNGPVNEDSSIQVVDGVKTILVCTNRSNFIEKFGHLATAVVLKVEGFMDSESKSIRSSSSSKPKKAIVPNGDAAVLVTSPETATVDLAAGWEQGCENVI